MILTAARWVIVPAGIDRASRVGLPDVAATINEVRDTTNPDLDVLAVVAGPIAVTSTRIRAHARRRLGELIGNPELVATTVIRHAPLVAEQCRELGLLTHEYAALAESGHHGDSGSVSLDPTAISSAAGGLAADWAELVGELLTRYSRGHRTGPTLSDVMTPTKQPPSGGFDPESPMAGFQARRPAQRRATIPPPPTRPRSTPPAASPLPTPPPHSRPLSDGAATPGPRGPGRPRNTTPDDLPPPPFGNRRDNRIAYTVNLPTALARRLEAAVQTSRTPTTYGAVAVEAIHTQWQSLRDEVESTPADDVFPAARHGRGRLTPKTPHVRKVFYITPDEAAAVDAVREELGGIQLGQLHRLALDRHLPAHHR